ncbi:alpha/beta hydrolase [Mobilicoccus pelagius]|uniref:Esterase n=1 Tax=Mobilicoccus pelagius NBRC 104925 TaxID=1089455 RepID=H5UVI5_9MICO|nr:alpha/beta hydrolase-fold protein [Mobilicoccus pelagius]GAB49743.1 hypothetical protein MOPEL_134_00270 [Mobilicoccus pelagius NBRC 104925]
MFGVTGLGTVLVAWACAIGALAAVTRAWPHLAHPGLRSVLTRVVAQLLVAVLLVVAAGATVNRAGLWFVSWRDLGSVVLGPPTGALDAHGATPATAAAAQVGPWGPTSAAAIASPPSDTDPHTGLRSYSLTGPASGHTGTVFAWVPPQPVRSALQVFHGYPVSPQSAFANLGLGDHGDGALRHTVVLLPDWSPRELDTECVDGPASAMETWLTTDVPAWAARTFGVPAERTAWTALGYSAGGWCAAMSAMRHPETYAAAVSLGGYTRPLFAPGYEPLSPTGGGHDLPLLARRDPPPVAVLVQYSTRDTLVAPSVEELVAAARPPLSVTRWSTPHSGHRVGAWKPLIPEALAWLDHVVPGTA